MVLEHAVLDVIPGQEAAFEEAFLKAKRIISAAAGFVSLRLSRCIEQPNQYLLLVEWDTLEHHTEGFRGSAAYQEWRHLLHHFYDPFPTVDHYAEHMRISCPEHPLESQAEHEEMAESRLARHTPRYGAHHK